MKQKSKLYRQTKAERIQNHQTSSSTNAKGSSLDRKHRKGLETPTQNTVNGNGTILINNCFKCKCIECPQPKDKDWLNGYKNKTPICCLLETHLKTRDTYSLKVKDWKKILHANRDQKKARVAILISDKIDFKQRL